MGKVFFLLIIIGLVTKGDADTQRKEFKICPNYYLHPGPLSCPSDSVIEIHQAVLAAYHGANPCTFEDFGEKINSRDEHDYIHCEMPSTKTRDLCDGKQSCMVDFDKVETIVCDRGLKILYIQYSCESTGGSTGAIVGGVIGALLAVVIIIVVLVCFLKRRRKSASADKSPFSSPSQSFQNNTYSTADGRQMNPPHSTHQDTDQCGNNIYDNRMEKPSNIYTIQGSTPTTRGDADIPGGGAGNKYDNVVVDRPGEPYSMVDLDKKKPYTAQDEEEDLDELKKQTVDDVVMLENDDLYSRAGKYLK